MSKRKSEKKGELCPLCDTPLKDAPGIGPFCPNKECPVADGADVYKDRIVEDGGVHTRKELMALWKEESRLKLTKKIRSIECKIRSVDYGDWEPAGDCPNCVRNGCIKTLRRREYFRSGAVERVEMTCPACGFWTIDKFDTVNPLTEKSAVEAKQAELRHAEECIKEERQRIEEKLAELRKQPLPENVRVLYLSGNPRMDDLLYGGIPQGSQILIMGPPFLGKETYTDNFILEGLTEKDACLVITTDCTPAEIIEEMDYLCPKRATESLGTDLFFIDAYSPAMGMASSGSEGIWVVNHPTDYKNINGCIEEFMNSNKNRRLRVVVRSISAFVTLSDPVVTYRFIQALTGRLKKVSAVGLYLLDKGMHDEQEIMTISHLMCGAIEFKTDGLKTFLRIDGICDVQSRMWIQYQYSKKGLSIGSFCLGHIGDSRDRHDDWA